MKKITIIITILFFYLYVFYSCSHHQRDYTEKLEYRIDDLESQINDLESQIYSQDSKIDDLESRIDDLEYEIRILKIYR